MPKHMHHSKLHGSGMMGSESRDSGKPRHGTYTDMVDEPHHQKIHKGHVSASADLGMMKCCADFKEEAADQAWGQSGKDGLMRDEAKIRSQFRPAYSDDTGY
jgi:hypothetical protein